MAAQRRYGVPAAVTIAQAIDESGWGGSELAIRDHNLFGIKGVGPAGSDPLPTQEYENGQWASITTLFRVYHDVAESIDDHGRTIAESGSYRNAMAERGDPDAFAQALTGVYATNPDYGSKLVSLMQQYDLYRFGMTPAASRAVQPTQPVRPAQGARPGQAAQPEQRGRPAGVNPSRPSTAPTSPGRQASHPRGTITPVPGSAPDAPPGGAAVPGVPQAGPVSPAGAPHSSAQTSSAPSSSAPSSSAPSSSAPSSSAPSSSAQTSSAASDAGPASTAAASAMPADAMPASAMPADAMPASAIRATTLAARTPPATTMPARGTRASTPWGSAATATTRVPAASTAAASTATASTAAASAASIPAASIPPASTPMASAARARAASIPARTSPAGRRRYRPQLPLAVEQAFITKAKVPLLHAEPLYRDVADHSGLSWELLAACDWMQCEAQPRRSPVHGEKLGTVNPDGSVYRTRSEALQQCAEDLVDLASSVYGIDLLDPALLSVRQLADAFAAFRWGGLLRLHRTSSMEFPYSVAGLTAQHLSMRWPKINEPDAPDKPGGRFRRPFGAVPVALSLNYPVSV